MRWKWRRWIRSERQWRPAPTSSMLDNMSDEAMKEAVQFIAGRAEVECSGNVTRENIRRLKDIGVDYVSSGALTHSAPILDLSMKHLRPLDAGETSDKEAAL